MICPRCRRDVPKIIVIASRDGTLTEGCERDLRPRVERKGYRAKKVWVGAEVYSEAELKSDSLRADTERDLLRGPELPPWFQQRARKRHIDTNKLYRGSQAGE